MQNRIANTSSYRNFQSLNEINAQVRTDPAGFVEHCEALYNHTIDDVARHILTTTRSVVLLAGPSGSGKTTTAKRLAEAMERDGVETHTVELDDYFLPLDRSDLSIDWESPDRVDLPLLSAHLDALGRGEGYYGVANANARALAGKLRRAGYAVEFRYPGGGAVKTPGSRY